MDKILIIDDDVELCGMLREFFRPEGFRVDAANDGQRGLAKAITGDYGLAILDIMLPRLNGLDVLKELRVGTRLPVLLLTARGEEVDRILGLELGADDYLPKPFNPRELVARVRAVLRRANMPKHENHTRAEHIIVGEVEMDTGNRSLTVLGNAVELTSVEFGLLEVLLKNAGRIVARDELAKFALGREFSPFDRSVDVHVSKLRRKLSDSGREKDFIKTVRNSGYMFAQPAAFA